MKKTLALLVAACLLLGSATAMAEDSANDIGYSGKVTYAQTISVLAPFGGMLQDYAVKVGDTVSAGQVLFTLSTTKVYAPFDGTVRGLQVQAGDEAQSVIDRYGALLYLESPGKYTISATTSGAYDSENTHNVNRYLNEGKIVYLRSSEDNSRTGEGIVTSVSGRNFTVEVLQSTLDLEDKVSIYQSDAFASAERIATNARVQREDSTAVTAEGSVLRCMVSEGQSVKRGDVLMETVTGTLDRQHLTSEQVVAPADGVVVTLPQTSGSTVSKDAILATVYAQSALEVTFDIDESELSQFSIGQDVRVTFDAMPELEAIGGTVTAISSLSNNDDGDAQYTATVQLNSTDGLRSGMSVSVYAN